MLCAYYSMGCDSRALFEDLAIARDSSFEEHLNTHSVILLDMTDLLHRGDDVVEVARRLITNELCVEFPHVVTPEDYYADAILAVVRYTGQPFVFLIDEWDAPIRECTGAMTRRYIDFLRSLFKNANFTAEAVAVAYMTGILPIKRYNTQSAISEFREYTMLSPERYAPYVGFTADEVRSLCNRHNMDYEEARRWYDGYELPNPNGGAALQATLEGDAASVAASVAVAHDSRVGPDWYNDEQSLRFAVKLAYLTAIERYAEVEELPSGHGFADIVYLPKRYSRLPALVVELKWDNPVETALSQIRNRNYPKVLEDYGGPMLLVGITYSKKTKEHSVVIERVYCEAQHERQSDGESVSSNATVC